MNITTTICEAWIKLVDKNATLSCDATKGPCGKCALLGIECKPVPKQLSLLHQDVIYYHSRWRTALETGDKAMAKEAKSGLTGKSNELMDAIDELETPTDTSMDAAVSASEVAGSKGKEGASSSPKTMPTAKATKTAGKKPSGVVKKPATPRTPKPKAQAQLRSKAEKALVAEYKAGPPQHSKAGTPQQQHSPAAQTSATLMNMMASDRASIMANDVLGVVPKYEGTHALPDYTVPAHAMENSTGSSYYNNEQYHGPASTIISPADTIEQTNPFTNDQNMFDHAIHQDDFSIFHHDQFLEHHSLTASPTSDPSFFTVDHQALPASTPFTMPSTLSGAGSMHGGLHVNHDVGTRILEQLQTLNTTMSGIYEMMRQQQHR